MMWAQHVACMGERKVHTGFWWSNLRGKDHLEDLDVGWWMTLKSVFKKGMGVLSGCIWLSIGPGGSCW
jgi:hypothetical protein